MNEHSMDYLPIFLDVRERPVVVIGGGAVAARKTELLLKAGATITVVAPALSEPMHELTALVARRALRHVAARFEPYHLDGATLAVAATGLAEVNESVRRAGANRGIPVNVVDDPQRSTFILPAIVDRSPVIVAVGTNGSSPVLARQVRAELETLLPARLGELARFAGSRRRDVQTRLEPARRRSFWERILRGPIRSLVLTGRIDAASRAFDEALVTANAPQEKPAGEVYLIGAGPGDPDLLTLRAVQLLQQADVVLYDRLVTPGVLDRARRDARLVFVGKEPGDRGTGQEEINRLLVRYAQQGLRVARLKGGDPFIFGRGGEELEALLAHGIPFTVAPGITAALGAGASAGIPLTHRNLSQSVIFATGHDAGEDRQDWTALARAHQTVVFYMAVGRLEAIASRLIAAGAPASRPAALVERATWADQRVVRGTLGSIAAVARESAVAAPALLIVGEVAALESLASVTPPDALQSVA
jgi:uroporphyrin-III C-methyltransferase/precorrin-2 dehydrogenase/sirohydrochlorin ferrochelatase